MEERASRKTRTGIVTSDKMDKTITDAVVNRKSHPIYGKTMTTTVKLKAHDGENNAKEGDTVEVHYVGTLEDGTQFDSSRDRGDTFSFTIGEGYVIQGWEQGIPGMKVGGLRKLTIPSDLGYGDYGTGPIPGGATLIFEVELVSIK